MARRVKRTPYAGHAGPLRAFIREVDDLAKAGRSHQEVLSDFLELAYCAFSKRTRSTQDAQEACEQQYMDLVRKRPKDYVRAMPRLLGLMPSGIEEHGDFLACVAGELGALNEGAGQFFTPFALCRMMAETNLDGVDEIIAEHGFVKISDPACGAGGMLLAAADVLEAHGHNVQHCMLAHAKDISALAVHAAYLQLSMRGIPAIVEHGDTLRMELRSQATTPAWEQFLAHQRSRQAERPPVGSQAAFDFGETG